MSSMLYHRHHAQTLSQPGHTLPFCSLVGVVGEERLLTRMIEGDVPLDCLDNMGSADGLDGVA